MAGGSPDRTKYRLAYDLDGTTIIYFVDTGVSQPPSTTFSSSRAKLFNSEPDQNQSGVNLLDIPRPSNTYFTNPAYIVFMFPQLMNITGYEAFTFYSSDQKGASQPIEYSTDTITGIDGTWINGGTTLSTLPDDNLVRSTYRDEPISLSLNNIKALRFKISAYSVGSTYNSALGIIHLYGSPAGNDVLKYWHPTLDQELDPAYFDFGYAYRGTTATKSFRIKNTSSAQIANTVTLSIDDATSYYAPTTASQHSLAKSDQTFGSSISISSINPGSISELLYLRKTTSSTAVIGLASTRIKAVVGSWTT